VDLGRVASDDHAGINLDPNKSDAEFDRPPMNKDKLRELVDSSLSTADERWKTHGTRLLKLDSKTAGMGAPPAFVPSHIPGHAVVETAKPTVSSFIAWMLDLRDSTKHMTERIASAKATELHRIYLETTALLPATASIVADHGGSVTEFQGDGVLALFPFPEDQSPSEERDQAVYAAFFAAEDALECVDTVINPVLSTRYALPPIKVGIGLALSPALVTTVGFEAHQQPAAFGQCVWRASKLSKGHGTIEADGNLHMAWPRADNGTIQFRKRAPAHEFDSYVVSRQKKR
jgi:class 3 adenylate cyclase